MNAEEAHHTHSVTTLGELRVGNEVNVEIDVVARYMDRLMLPFAELRKITPVADGSA
jgi:riboflavin synthase alpha subunit